MTFSNCNKILYMAICLKIDLDYKYPKWKAVYSWLLQVYQNSVSNQNLTQGADLGHFKSPGQIV